MMTAIRKYEYLYEKCALLAKDDKSKTLKVLFHFQRSSKNEVIVDK